ncbi:MAG TPA: alpha-L-arabinofuranosidase C-terminal domain-containing protein, partial [Bacilli bacterium]
RLYKIACGPNTDDYGWMDTLLKRAGRHMDGISLHYYTVPGEWDHKGSATEFGAAEWFGTLKKALFMDELIAKHSAIMDCHDPKKRIGLIVDEWGTWYDVEPGTNPGFLYQQNTMRDALVAGLHLHIFHAHNDRVKMANIAQTINVLQAMILTEGEKMVLTPTYHVFDLFKVHQGATRLQTCCSAAEYALDGDKLPQVSVSASRNAAGEIHISLCNLDHQNEADVQIVLRGLAGEQMKAEAMTLAAADMSAHNTFAKPDAVKPVPFANFFAKNGEISAKLAPMSVTVLRLAAK